MTDFILPFNKSIPINRHNEQCKSLPQEFPSFEVLPTWFLRVCLVLVVVGFSLVIIEHSLFHYYRSRYQSLRQREYTNLVLVSMGLVFNLLTGPISILVPFPTGVHMFLALHCVPLLCAPVPIICFSFFLRHKFGSLAGKLLSGSSSMIESSNTFHWAQQCRQLYKFLRNKQTHEKTLPLSSSSLSSLSALTRANLESPSNASVKDNLSGGVGANSGQISLETLEFLKFLTSRRMRILYGFLFCLPFTILAIVNYVEISTLTALCIFGPVLEINSIFMTVMGGLIVLIGFIASLIIRKLPDPLGISSELKFYAISGLITLIGFILTTSLDVVYLVITAIGTFLLQFSLIGYPVIMSIRNGNLSHPKHMELNSEADVVKTLNESLFDPEFEKFLANEFAVESLLFYRDAIRYEDCYADDTDGTRLFRAKRIYKLYIKPDAVLLINIPYLVTKRIEENLGILSESKKPPASDLFQDAKRECLGMMLGSFIRFNGQRSIQ